ncbi:MAG: AAA domain-containing protein [Candidatus Sericytochromatia bacterium]
MSIFAELETLEALMQAEQSYVREQQRLLYADTPLEQRCREGLSLYPLQLNESLFGLGGRLILVLETTRPLNMGAFQPGQTVALFAQALPGETLNGVIQRRQGNALRVYLNSSELPEGFDTGKLGLDLYDDETTWREMQRAVQTLRQTDSARLQNLREILLGRQAARFFDDQQVAPEPAYNRDQQAAVARVMQARDLALIHGPPGTGKTTTLLACIRRVLETEKQVLVCAPSNAAVDLLASRLSAQGHRVLRLGHPARLQESVWPLTLDEQLEQHPNATALRQLRKEMNKLRREVSRYRRQFGPAERAERDAQRAELKRLRKLLQELEDGMVASLLEDAQVIACTLVGAAGKLLYGRRFQTVFIDEAAQALEGACWIPVLKAERVVLAGDHQQLPPTIRSPQAQALSVTLFEKAIQRQPQSSVRLTTQYRMHEQIMAFPSSWFYENTLEAAPGVGQRRLQAAQAAEHPLNQPLLWVDTAGCGFDEERDSDSGSVGNPGEVRLLQQILSEWLSDPDWPSGPVTIGVIAPYRRQVEALRAGLQLTLPAGTRLEVETVDSFQGQERDVICLSFVRSNEAGEIGFLSDLRRTNVAMTRARSKLLLIGDTATLGSHPFYRELQEQVEAVDGYHSAWEWSGSIDF